jgi:CRISPR-associated protein Cas1
MQGHGEQEFRQACIDALTRSEALDAMIDTIKATAEQCGRLAQGKAASA